jgi:N,N'-diacetyllegionaminate synthase
MKIKTHDTDKRIFIVAEVGNNHEGDFEVACQLIHEAHKAGVDAVKFQSFEAAHYVTSSDKERFERLSRFHLGYESLYKLKTLADSLGLVFFSTPFDISTANFLNKIQQLFKISSSDNNFLPLINTVAEFRKPTLISTGLADMDYLRDLRSLWRERSAGTELAFLHCVSSYPTPANEANLLCIKTIASEFPDVTVGYSDHTEGIEAATYSAALGARIIEKHFTLDKNFSDFRDHKLSADSRELIQLTKNIRNVEKFLGDGVKRLQPCEREAVKGARRSIAYASNLDSGATLTSRDITWVRPGVGSPPGDEHKFLDRILCRAVKKGELIYPHDFREI